ncbi:MAG: radical SAM protein [Candidatus Helarchaeota archaeon]|nr:radical SAM protein [Candidatus Helarchaeota archaeon]
MCIVTYSWKKSNSTIKIEKFFEEPKVRWAEIDIVDNCDFDCIWCYSDAPEKKNKIMVYETFKRIIDKLVLNDFIQVTLSGGEPLLHKKIDRFVEYAYRKGLIVHINSNGYYFTKELAKKLKNCGLTQIQMNLESRDPQLHDFIRGKPGSHEKTLEAFQNAFTNDITTVLLTVISTYNVNELTDLMIFSKKNNIDRFRVWDMVPKGKGQNMDEIYVKNYSKILNQLTKDALENEVKEIISYDPVFNYEGEVPMEVTLLEVPCPHARGLMMNIEVGGDVNICCTVRNVKLYNILEHEDIQTIHKRKNEELFNALKNVADCQNCGLYGQCDGGCIARYDNYKRDLQCINYS